MKTFGLFGTSGGARGLARAAGRDRARRSHESPSGSAFGSAMVERLEDRRLLAADLNVLTIETDNTVAVPGTAFDGQFTIKNDGDASTNPYRVEFRLSRNTTWGDGDDVILGFRQVNAPLTPGGQTTLDEDFDLPRNALSGNYFLGALADSLGLIAEPNENNNLRFTTIAQIIIANPNGQADIDLESAGVAATTGTYDAGQAFPGTATYRNNGIAPSGGFTIIYFISLNTTYGDADDIQLAINTTSAGLGAGSQFVDNFQLTIPINATSGDYYLGVFVDARFDVNEPLEEDNNIDFSATPAVRVVGVPTIPDLQAVEISTAGGTFEPGDDITFTASIRNGGNAVTGAFEVTYALSTNTTLGDSDDIVLFFKVVLNSLAAGATFTDTRTVEIPSGAAPGNYYLGMVLDPDDDLDEGTSEGNNTDFSATPNLAIELPPPPAPQITMLGGGVFGTEIEHNAKAMRNNGTGYGPVVVEEFKSISYRISNTGTQPLVITLIEPRGQFPGDYEIIIMPDMTIEPGETSDFRVRFTPGEFGTRRANVAIFTNDPARPRFTMKVAGRGMPSEDAPDIDVRGNGNSISDNDKKARSNTDTRYGTIEVGQTVEITYTIRNEGGSTLTLSSPFVSIGGQDPTHFSVVVQPALTVLTPGQSTTFTVAFTPTSAGLKKAEVVVVSDDPDESPFNYRIIGTGVEA